jgi:hypothetical protein
MRRIGKDLKVGTPPSSVGAIGQSNSAEGVK